MTKELLQNMLLAFVAGFFTSFATAVQVWDKPPDKAALWAALLAAIYAGARGILGYVALKLKRPVTVDT